MTGILLEIILNVVGPVALCAAVGFAWAKLDQPFDSNMVTQLATHIGLPCLVFATLIGADLETDAFIEMGWAAFVTMVVFCVAGWGILRLLKLPIKTYLIAVAFANTGNIALPLALLAFGEEGLALGIAYFVVNILFMVTVGIAAVSGGFRPKQMLQQPLIYGAAISVFVLLTDVPVPAFVLKTTKLLGDFTIPLMLITLGVSLAKLKIDNIGASVLISCLRLGLGLIVGFGTAAALGMDGTARAVVIIMCAMPVAVTAFLLAEAYGGDGRPVAGSVVISTVMAFMILPALLWHLTG